MPYIIRRWYFAPCAECDAEDAGIFNRVDHGCASEVDVSTHETLSAAKSRANRLARDGTAVTIYGPDGEAVWSL
jgi:hypothetical protein